MRKGQSLTIICFTALAITVLPLSFGFIHDLPLPQTLLECYMLKSDNVSIADVPARVIQEFCIRKFTLDTMADKENYSRNISANGIRYLKSLFRQVESEMYELDKQKEKGRQKRQMFYTWRHRREIRTLSNRERNRIFSCFNRLKRDYSVDPRMNTYDLIGSLHSGQAARLMHNGPGFLSRHMVYLLVIETACRIPIPYWDMTMDAEMMDPTASVIWSDRFFGPGNGAVRRGPFRHWITPNGSPIIRNIGAGGASLARKSGIRAMLTRWRTSQITEPQPANSIFSIEVHHNGVHNWIDGHMAGLNTATWDPAFWFIHSFFQFLWVAFKNGQRARGINPQRDYPRGPRVPSGHEFYQRMNFMPFMRTRSNLEGFSNRYDRMVQYSPMPRCPVCGGSRYLYCRRGVCVPRASVRRRPRFFMRGKRSTSTELADQSVDNTTTNLMQSKEAALSALDKPYQNTFMINGKADSNNWVYIPVRVLYERRKGFNFHTGIPGMKSGKDMYDPENFSKKAKKIGLLQNQVNYTEECSSSGSGAAKVFVQSDGVNYAGRYKDYAIVDERQPVTSAMTYVAIKKPSKKGSRVMLTAYDTCGRSCRPACPVNKKHRVAYKACSGSFKVTSKFPLMYSSSYADAVSAMWNINLHSKGPLFRNNVSPITFVCDHQNIWPWSY